MTYAYVIVIQKKFINRSLSQSRMMHSYRVRLHQYAPVTACTTRLADDSDQNSSANGTEAVRVPAPLANGNNAAFPTDHRIRVSQGPGLILRIETNPATG